MTSHTRLSPGIEYNEIDRSRYGDGQDFSIIGTTSFVAGFADTGDDMAIRYVTSVKGYVDEYGYPTNECEKYMFNAVVDLLGAGGRVAVAKLPYQNASKGKYVATTYQVIPPLSGCRQVELLSAADLQLTSVSFISSVGNELIGADEFDQCCVNNSVTMCSIPNTIKIVDITRGRYGKANFQSRDEESAVVCCDVECLGVIPVLFGAANAMFYQGLVSNITSVDVDTVEKTTDISCFTCASDVSSRTVDGETGIRFSQFATFNFATAVSAESINDSCVSKTAVDAFPRLQWLNGTTIDKDYAKHIGVAVFEAYLDEANDSKVGIRLVESFVGSLDRNSRDQNAASNYIGNIINANSRYINFFSNFRTDADYYRTSMYCVQGQTFTSTAFSEKERVKHIDYVDSVIEPLSRMLDRASDPNQTPIDLVVDAGTSNIAQYAKDTFGEDAASGIPGYCLYNADAYPFVQDGHGGLANWKMGDGQLPAWQAVLKKFDNFCKETRKDCMFVADGPRCLVLDGDKKIVRDTSLSNTIENRIIPHMKHMSVLNSSYSAGYCNWFMGADARSGDQIWIPPSIKAARVYVQTDAYYHPWNAPAGLVRGVVDNAFDISFNPRMDEAGRIYDQAWNYAVSYPLAGIVVEGQKTFQLKKTALDRVNVRRLMLWIEKRVVAMARRFLYEGNTAYTRQRFVDQITPIFESAMSGDGISDYAVKCDETLNTVDVVERHELRCICAVKPIKAIEWIKLDFIVTNQSADVAEEVMR